MGYTTDFVGHVDVAPRLNNDEILYLTAFSRSRRGEREEGPYAVPGNPYAPDELPLRAPVAEGQPGYRCDWVPCWDGCCLTYNGAEKFYGSTAWLRYLIDHFLKPGAFASTLGGPQFAGFTFDHVLDGTVVGCRRDTKELIAIDVRANEVEEVVIRPGDSRYSDYPPLPYEEAIDRERDALARLRGRRSAPGLRRSRPSLLTHGSSWSRREGRAGADVVNGAYPCSRG